MVLVDFEHLNVHGHKMMCGKVSNFYTNIIKLKSLFV
jgi:hypothetical protein